MVSKFVDSYVERLKDAKSTIVINYVNGVNKLINVEFKKLFITSLLEALLAKFKNSGKAVATYELAISEINDELHRDLVTNVSQICHGFIDSFKNKPSLFMKYASTHCNDEIKDYIANNCMSFSEDYRGYTRNVVIFDVSRPIVFELLSIKLGHIEDLVKIVLSYNEEKKNEDEIPENEISENSSDDEEEYNYSHFTF